MALLNVSLCTRIPPKPHLTLTKPSLSVSRLHFLSFPRYDKPQALIPNKKLVEDFAKTGFLAILSVSLFFTDPALAFKSILRQANFKGAKLLGASFFDADLTGADLSDADLRSVDFSLANVTKANLSNANLEGALATGNTSFKGSNITGAGRCSTTGFNIKNLLWYKSRVFPLAAKQNLFVPSGIALGAKHLL
ncbi:hypothetical protein OIU84_020752 [Salix udensis]|uniref:Uncharacterized protein n=1 Tax=Salix udensis TaxID=889485 RepID=A0AAD6KUJ1_9ROSI|nr:hypothetical protein OIU84_020752 [Salix udensis]